MDKARAAGDVETAARLSAMLAGADQERAAESVRRAVSVGMPDDQVATLLLDFGRDHGVPSAETVRWLSQHGVDVRVDVGEPGEPGAEGVGPAEIDEPETLAEDETGTPVAMRADSDKRVEATPAAVKLAQEEGVDMANVAHSGARVTQSDVQAYLDTRG